MIRKILLCAVVMLSGCGAPIDVSGPDTVDGRRPVMTAAIPPAANEPPAEVRMWYLNNERPGSCVQMGIGIHGIRCNDLRAATLPFDTIYGPAIRGGSTPSRVAAYCNERGIKILNVTGEATKPVITWAVDTGRGAALGFDKNHYQNVLARDKEQGVWYVCDNRWPDRIYAYPDDDFWAMHASMGYQWCVVLDCPAPPPAPRRVVR